MFLEQPAAYPGAISQLHSDMALDSTQRDMCTEGVCIHCTQDRQKTQRLAEHKRIEKTARVMTENLTVA